VQRLVLGQGARLAATGLALGALVSLVLGALVESLLYGVPARDPLTYAAVIGVLAAAALLAAWLPARRAGRVNPMEALRND
jgi:ABC-type antimicrobial peptide transport system permease subunit